MMSIVKNGYYRHLKTDHRYRVVCVAFVEAHYPDKQVVIYQRAVSSNTEPYWSRPIEEFTDGRFVYEGGGDD